ncbi:MAG: hypothetical protein A2201_04275 [Alicyclobacillus sp. RIFOXYA1_FULL_53_8]|nr:MAG: hypothetical protein A2201_04275 [Alicyclobacillus sp. RIFOXYA1_FULL_53_8]
MSATPTSIPRPLVRINQWFIVVSVLTTWITGQSGLLLLPWAAGVLGLVFGFNPIMRAGKFFLRRTPSSYIPEDPTQQQFNQIIAVTCLSLGGLGYVLHWWTMAYVFTTLVAAAAFVAILGFCVGCFIRFQWTQFRYRRSARSAR